MTGLLVAVAVIAVPATIAIAPAAAAGAVLAPLGFGAAGPIAGKSPVLSSPPSSKHFKGTFTDSRSGSWAAAIQGPAVVAGSPFAIAQATAMGAGAVGLVGKVAGVVTGAVVAGMAGRNAN